MIQNTTFLRRAVGSLLVALVTLVGFHANAQLDFSVSTEITWNEDPDSVTANLTALNGRITEAIPDTVPDNTCYTVSGVAALEIPEAHPATVAGVAVAVTVWTAALATASVVRPLAGAEDEELCAGSV